jgi:hypothetical protein
LLRHPITQKLGATECRHNIREEREGALRPYPDQQLWDHNNLTHVNHLRN